MKPKVVIHNTISLDLCVTGFKVDMMAHYAVASSFNPDASLVGSITAKTGVEEYSKKEKESETDFQKPDQKKDKPYFVLIDSEGKMWNLLHLIRRSEHFRDVIVLVSPKTSKDYIFYLEKRNYDYIKTGKIKVDLKKSIEKLAEKYNIKTIMSDTGPTLSSLLLEKGLVDEMSLIIVPEIVNNKLKMFQNIKKKLKLDLLKQEKLANSVHVLYKIK